MWFLDWRFNPGPDEDERLSPFPNDRRLDDPAITHDQAPTTLTCTARIPDPRERLTTMSPPIELFLTTIVSSPTLRQRQGNPSTVHLLRSPKR